MCDEVWNQIKKLWKIKDQIKNLIVIKQPILNKKNWWGTELRKINSVCEKTIIFERHVQLSPDPTVSLFNVAIIVLSSLLPMAACVLDLARASFFLLFPPSFFFLDFCAIPGRRKKHYCGRPHGPMY